MSRARPDRRVFVYGLRDPRDGELRYVGQSVWPKSRALGHRNPQASAPRVVGWVEELAALGLEAEVVVLREVVGNLARAAELDEIEIAALSGCSLLNTQNIPALPILVGGVRDPAPRLRLLAEQKARRIKGAA